MITERTYTVSELENLVRSLNNRDFEYYGEWPRLWKGASATRIYVGRYYITLDKDGHLTNNIPNHPRKTSCPDDLIEKITYIPSADSKIETVPAQPATEEKPAEPVDRVSCACITYDIRELSADSDDSKIEAVPVHPATEGPVDSVSVVYIPRDIPELSAEAANLVKDCGIKLEIVSGEPTGNLVVAHHNGRIDSIKAHKAEIVAHLMAELQDRNDRQAAIDVIPGLWQIREAERHNDSIRRTLERCWDSGSSVLPGVGSGLAWADVESLEAAYPVAVAWRKLEDDSKSAITELQPLAKRFALRLLSGESSSALMAEYEPEKSRIVREWGWSH